MHQRLSGQRNHPDNHFSRFYPEDADRGKRNVN